MLSGTLPFPGNTPYAVFDSILHTTPRPLSDYRQDLPDRLHQIVERSLAKDPNASVSGRGPVHRTSSAPSRAPESGSYNVPLPTLLVDYRRNTTTLRRRASLHHHGGR